MKKQFCLTLFLILLTIDFSFTAKLQKAALLMNEKSKKQNEDFFKAKLFSAPPTNCKPADEVLRDTQEEILKKKDENKKQFLRANKSELWWVKNWGYGESAYFYDFLEPLLLTQFVADAKEVYTKLMEIDNKKDGLYEDPFDYNNFFSSDMTDDERKKLSSNLKLINENYVKEIYDISVNAVQLHKAMKAWKWYKARTTADYAKDFVERYDSDGDGRLCVREIVLGCIDYNKQNVGDPKVNYIFYATVKNLLAMFSFFDCNDDGYISAEEIWKNLRNLNRGNGEKRYDIFGINEGLRIKSVNDFLLKCHSSRNGLINKSEFISCILFGFWNRQCEKTKVLDDGSRSLIALRWGSNGTADKAFLKALASK